MQTFLNKVSKTTAFVLIFIIGFSCKKDEVKTENTEFSFNSVVATAQMDFTTLGKKHNFKCFRVEDVDEIILEDSTLLKLNLRTTKEDGSEHTYPDIIIEINSTMGFKKGDVFKVSDYFQHRSVLFATRLYSGLSNQYLATNNGSGFGHGELEILEFYGDYMKGKFKFHAERPEDIEDVVDVTKGEFEGEVIYSN